MMWLLCFWASTWRVCWRSDDLPLRGSCWWHLLRLSVLWVTGRAAGTIGFYSGPSHSAMQGNRELVYFASWALPVWDKALGNRAFLFWLVWRTEGGLLGSWWWLVAVKPVILELRVHAKEPWKTFQCSQRAGCYCFLQWMNVKRLLCRKEMGHCFVSAASGDETSTLLGLYLKAVTRGASVS